MIVKITSLTSQCLNICLVHVAILLLCSSQANTQSLTLDNQYLFKVYYENLVHVEVVKESASGKMTPDQLKHAVDSDSTRYAQAVEISGMPQAFEAAYSNMSRVTGLVDLFLPKSRFGKRIDLEMAIKNGQLDGSRFQLECLNMTGNRLIESFLEDLKPSQIDAGLYSLVALEYFSSVRLAKFSQNNFRHLEKKHFQVFAGTSSKQSHLETLLFDSNKLSSIRHDTFYELKHLKYLDLSNNRLKLIHPLTFTSYDSELIYLNLARNHLKAVFYTPLLYSNATNNQTDLDTLKTSSLKSLKYFYLSGNEELNCDCGLVWLYRARNKLVLDDFSCNSIENKSEKIVFNSIANETFLKRPCKSPSIIVNTKGLEQTSSFSLFRSFSTRWFDWTLFYDKLPVTTPYPYLMSQEKIDELKINDSSFLTTDYLDKLDETKIDDALDMQEKHVFLTWRTSDVVFDCTNKKPNMKDESNSTIIWKTQHGYLSYLDKDLTSSLNSFLNEELDLEDDDDDDEAVDLNQTDINGDKFRNSFKIFYQMNKLTRISNNLTVKVGQKFGGQTFSTFLVNANNQLIVTNIRQIVAGPFVCISINEAGISTYEYDIHVRVGVGEYFIYCLFVSLLCGVVPSIISLIICCVCEYKADRDYNIQRHYTCYPTPMTGTPPNFDFNDWMANAASYLPSLKIQDTLDQVSKKLRRGMGKASIAVKTLGLTSSAYIYSVYEHSTQRWIDIKGYVPTLNVPTLTLPTMKYPPVGQLATRMRTGMGNMFIQVKEFCGTSDLSHTTSIGDLESDTNSYNAVGGNCYIIDKIDLKQKQKQQQQHQNYYKFLNFLREESRNVNSKKQRGASSNKFNNNTSIIEMDEQVVETPTSASSSLPDNEQIFPSTSAQALAKYSDEPTVVALPKLNLIITFSNTNDEIQNVEDLSEDEDDGSEHINVNNSHIQIQ